MTSSNQRPANAWRWFDPRGRTGGTFAFILNRITAIGLTVYLYLHLVILGKLAQGPEAFDSFIETAKSPLFITGELLVIVAGLYHGLNGLRIVLTSFGIGSTVQKQLFYAVLVVTVLGGAYFALHMFSG